MLKKHLNYWELNPMLRRRKRTMSRWSLIFRRVLMWVSYHPASSVERDFLSKKNFCQMWKLILLFWDHTLNLFKHVLVNIAFWLGTSSMTGHVTVQGADEGEVLKTLNITIFLAALQPYKHSCHTCLRRGKKFNSFICLVIKTEVSQYVFNMYI